MAKKADQTRYIESWLPRMGNLLRFVFSLCADGRASTDNETGLYFYRARYFDPQTGRFLSEDPSGFNGGINLYAYTMNSPIGWIDPTGLAMSPEECRKLFEDIRRRADILAKKIAKYDPIADGLGGATYQAGGQIRKTVPGSPLATNCPAMMAAAKADYGGLNISPDGSCPCNYHAVILVIGFHVHEPGKSPTNKFDFHWYRQDANGAWSSKHGTTDVGAQLPSGSACDKDAKKWGYDFNCGWACAPNQ